MPRERPIRNRPQCHKCKSYNFYVNQAHPYATHEEWFVQYRCTECGEIAKDERLLKLLLGED